MEEYEVERLFNIVLKTFYTIYVHTDTHTHTYVDNKYNYIRIHIYLSLGHWDRNDRQTDGCMMDGWTPGQTERQTQGWMDRWADK